MRLSRTNGFTLIELLVVIAIIGLLSSVVLASLNTARARARDAQRAADIREVYKALELYHNDHNAYPSTGSLDIVYEDPGCKNAGPDNDVLTADWVPGLVSGGYIAKLPQDPLPKDEGAGYTGGGACYMYASDGNYFILTAWSTVESVVPASSGLYAKVGFREPVFNVQGAYHLCNWTNFDRFYEHSYTIAYTDCTW